MYLSEFRLDPTLYFNVVPRDVVNYTQQLWRPFSVGTCWYRTHSMPHGVADRKLISIGVTQDNTYLLGFKDRIYVLDAALPLICIQKIRSMVVDHNDHIWVCVYTVHSWCVIEYTLEGTILEFLEFNICPFIYDLIAHRAPVSYGMSGDCNLPWTNVVKCALMSDNSRVAIELELKLTRFDPRMSTVSNSTKLHDSSKLLIVDADDNVIILCNGTTLIVFDKTLRCRDIHNLSAPKINYVAIDKNGSLLCATENTIVVIDTV